MAFYIPLYQTLLVLIVKFLGKYVYGESYVVSTNESVSLSSSYPSLSSLSCDIGQTVRTWGQFRPQSLTSVGSQGSAVACSSCPLKIKVALVSLSSHRGGGGVQFSRHPLRRPSAPPWDLLTRGTTCGDFPAVFYVRTFLEQNICGHGAPLVPQSCCVTSQRGPHPLLPTGRRPPNPCGSGCLALPAAQTARQTNSRRRVDPLSQHLLPKTVLYRDQTSNWSRGEVDLFLFRAKGSWRFICSPT